MYLRNYEDNSIIFTKGVFIIKKIIAKLLILSLLISGFSGINIRVKGFEFDDETLRVYPKYTVISPGESVYLTLRNYSSIGSTEYQVMPARSWSSDYGTVSVSKDGMVKGLSAGTAYITGMTEAGQTASCTVIVGTPPTGVSLNYYPNAVVGGQTTLAADVSPSNASNKELYWKSSNVNVATVDSYGTVKFRAVGSATITATLKYKDYISSSTSINVYQSSVAGISISPQNTKIASGEKIKLIPKVYPEGLCNPNIIWSLLNGQAVMKMLQRLMKKQEKLPVSMAVRRELR